MARISEQPLRGKALAGIQNCAQEAMKLLAVSAKSSPAAVVEAIDAFVYRWQKGERPSAKILPSNDAPLILGSLWGQQLAARFGWEWAMVTFHEHGDSVAPGVLSPDRSVGVYPVHFLMGCLQDAGVDATISLSFNMLEAGSVTGLPAGEYFNLMDGVQRIVPRD